MKSCFYVMMPALLFLTGCGSSNDEDFYKPEDRQKFRLVVLHAGIWSYDDSGNDSSMLGELTDYIPANHLLKETDTIPGEEGTWFGIEYMLTSSEDKESTLELRTIWVMPDKITDQSEGERFEAMEYPSFGNKNLIQYRLRQNGLNNQGRWQLRIYYEKRLLYRKNFFVR